MVPLGGDLVATAVEDQVRRHAVSELHESGSLFCPETIANGCPPLGRHGTIRLKIATVFPIIVGNNSAIPSGSPIRSANSAIGEHKDLPMRYKQ